MKKISFIISIILILATFSGCYKENGLEKITIVLDWTPNTNHTGIYMAKELGYYEELGIDLEILQPPESGAPALVAAGKAEFGISFQDELGPAYALSDPLPITAVSAIVSHNTSGFISAKTANVSSPKDFEGKKVVVWDTPIIRDIVRDLVEEDGGDFDKVELIFNNVSDPLILLKSDDTILWGYHGWDYTNVKLSGLDVNFLNISEINKSFDYYTPVIIANNDYINKNSQTVENFISATAKGYEYAINHPEESAKKLVELVPELDYEFILESQLYLSEEYKKDASFWGEIDKERWDRFYDWMYEKGIIENQIDENRFTNNYLPKG